MRPDESSAGESWKGGIKGNLISIITTDIELLEVFYAHTISPIAIATLTSIIMVIFIGRYHWLAGLLALAAYLIVGVAIRCGMENVAARREWNFGQTSEN